jgi:2-haloacid dehalogenase
MTAPPLAALVFDAYGTLYDVASVAGRCEHHFPGQGRPISDLWRQKQLEYTWLMSLMGRYRDFRELTEAGLRFACAALGAALSAEAAADLMEAYHRLAAYPEVPGALERLGRRLPLAILSNGTPEMLARVTAHAGLQTRFQHVLSVDELGIYKPSPRVYRLAVERLGVPADRIGFVSSNAWDVAGAKSFGLRVFWLNRLERTPERLGYDADAVIRTLDDLPALL